MRLLVVTLLAVYISFIYGKDVVISNKNPRLDTTGQIMDIHDGNTLYVDGVFYYYGAEYGLCEEPAGSNGCADFGVGNCGFQKKS
jgi:hypothetical protein